MKRFLKLYKVVNGEKQLVDYGVASQAKAYHKQGYVMEWSNHHTPVYKVLKREFDELWYAMPVSEQVRLYDIAIDDEMSMEERLMLLKSEVVRYNKQIWVKRPVKVRTSLLARLKEKAKALIDSLIPEPVFAMAHF